MTTDVKNPSGVAPAAIAPGHPLSKELCHRLWCRMVERLHRGESLITIQHYQRAMEEEYWAITHSPASIPVKERLHTMIALVNEQYPRTYMATGMQNCLSKAFEKNVTRLNWALVDVQTRGTKTLKKFLRRHLQELFLEAGLKAHLVDPALCVRKVARKMAEESDAPVLRALAVEADTSFESRATEAPTEAPSPSTSISPLRKREVQEAIEGGLVDAEEAGEWAQRQDKRHEEIEQAELAKVPDYAEAYVKRGLLTQVEANNLVKTYTEKDSKRTNTGEIRDKLKAKIRPALDYTTLYVEVFEALRRIPQERDEALKFLIRHKDLVITQGADADFSTASDALREDPELVQNISDLIERKDQEVRMIHSKLPPYGQVVKRNDSVTNLILEEAFIEDLRNKTGDELSEILNDPETEVRIRPAADMKCLIVLLDRLSTPSRFVQEVRICKAEQEIVQLYRSTKDRDKARNKVEHFLRRRLSYLYPDLKPYEREKIEQYSTELMKEKKKKPKAKPDNDEELSEEEIKQGIQLTRVEVRIAGRNKRVPYKIMEDPQEQGKHIILKRDPSTGALVPALSRGKKRYVEKDKDGFWKAV